MHTWHPQLHRARGEVGTTPSPPFHGQQSVRCATVDGWTLRINCSLVYLWRPKPPYSACTEMVALQRASSCQGRAPMQESPWTGPLSQTGRPAPLAPHRDSLLLPSKGKGFLVTAAVRHPGCGSSAAYSSCCCWKMHSSYCHAWQAYAQTFTAAWLPSMWPTSG